jgi:ribose transport system permease protein
MKRSQFSFYKALGLIVAALVAVGGAILGRMSGADDQLVILYALGTFALIIWAWHHLTVKWTYPAARQAGDATPDLAAGDGAASYLRGIIRANRLAVVVLLGLAVIFVGCSFAITGFFTLTNVLSFLVFIAFIVGAYALSRYISINKSVFIGCTVLIVLFVAGSLAIDGFASTANLKSMLLFAAFLGLACVGQTLVALLGGLDLSIPFVIGSSNVGLLYLISLGIPPWLAFIGVLVLGVAIGFVNGVLSFRLQGQALIVTLGVGFAVSGGTQIVTSIDTAFGGNVFGVVPNWLVNVATLSGTTFGLRIPPVVVLWIIVAVALILGLKNTRYGRTLYALGGSRLAARRLSISERAYWIGCYMIGGFFSALTGSLLLGWSGGGFIGVGDPYLFMTLAAVVVGGTSLLGGWGGYGFTIIGVLVLQVLTSFLVGLGLSFQAQQFVFGLLILPMVAIYGRSPHIRTQI